MPCNDDMNTIFLCVEKNDPMHVKRAKFKKKKCINNFNYKY